MDRKVVSFLGLWMVVAAAAQLPQPLLSTANRDVLHLERVNHPNFTNLEDLISLDRARNAQNFPVINFPVTGSFDPFIAGIYYTKVKLGSPPREYNVLIDTGSDVSWVSCSSCHDCPRLSGLGVKLNFYDSANSSTASIISCSDPICTSVECPNDTNQCAYTLRYTDESRTTGYYVSDLLNFDTILETSLIANSSAPIIFGCSTSLYGNLAWTDNAIDGIFGFDRRGPSLISQLSSCGISPRVFSHCLKGEGSGGILVLGEISNPRIVYTPLVPSKSSYNVHLQNIIVNGQIFPVDLATFATSGNRGTIVDSGATMVYLAAEAYEPFVNAITAIVSPSAVPIISGSIPCYLISLRFSNSITDLFPPVSLRFAGGASMSIRPADYLKQTGFSEGAAKWCLLFGKQDQGVTILGDLVLKDKIVVYDLARQRIGWADYDCSLPVNVSMISGKDKVNSARAVCHMLELMFFIFYLFWS